MKIDAIKSLLPDPFKDGKEIKKTGGGFESIFTDLVNTVNTNELESKKITEDFIQGKGVELHEVMIAGEKAKTSLELLMEIRNKTVDMYKELTRMSV
jgi:flagellar hook-basal body complex protein FliE